MELINEQKAKLFAIHLGCKVFDEYDNDYRYLFSVSLQGCVVSSKSLHTRNFDEVKLILRTIEQITDEEAIEVAKILLPAPFLKYKTGWLVTKDFAITGWPYIKIHHPKNVYSAQIDCRLCDFSLYELEESITNETAMQPALITQYLISIGVAVPLFIASGHPDNGKTAIDLNLAISIQQ